MEPTCHYSMKVLGKKENVEEFVKIIKADANYFCRTFTHEKHFCQIYEANVCEEGTAPDGMASVVLSGRCYKSIRHCLFNDGPETQIYALRHDFPEICRATLLPIEAKRLGLEIEIFSKSIDRGVQEHFVVNKGLIKVRESVTYYEVNGSEFTSKEKTEKALHVEFTEEEWENRGTTISRGGFDWVFSI